MSLGKPVIKIAIGRDRCKFLLSKMYYDDPNTPDNPSKTYYLQLVVSGLKNRFKTLEQVVLNQSYDEIITRFKGSSLKQYLTMLKEQ